MMFLTKLWPQELLSTRSVLLCVDGIESVFFCMDGSELDLLFVDCSESVLLFVDCNESVFCVWMVIVWMVVSQSFCV